MAKPGSAVAYIYIDYNDKERQTVKTILCSLLGQLLESMDAVPQEIQRIYDALPSDSKENTIDTIQCVFLFRKFVEEQCCRVFLLFDALDECPDMDHYSNEIRSRMIFTMKTLATFARIFVACRSHVNLALSIPDCLYMEIRAMDSDVWYYLEARKEQHSQLRNILISHPTLAKHTEDTICRKANGMFLLAQLQMDTLVKETSARNVNKALERLPQKLNETFGIVIERVTSQPAEHSTLAKHVISWIFFAKRPLRISELHEALAIEPGDTCLDLSGLHEVELLLSICCGLVPI